MARRTTTESLIWLLFTLAVCVGQVFADPTVEVDLGPAIDPIEQRLQDLEQARADHEARLAALEAGEPTDPTPGPGPVDPPPPPPPDGKETDLWLNVSHYRYTPVIEYRNGEYIVTDPRFVDLMSKWSGIRYMNWTGQLNRDVNWTWAGRVNNDLKQAAPHKLQYLQADGSYRWANLTDKWDATGVPLEAIIAVANATKTHVWWCAPQQADIDYMKHAGRLFATTLDPSLLLVVEIGNENWQSNRGWFYHERSQGDFGERMRLYAEDSAAKFKALAAGVNGVGLPRERLVRVMGGQLHNIGVLKSNALQHIDAADYDAISCAGYFGNSPATWISGSGGRDASIRGLNEHADLAEAINKQLLIYELNQHIDQDTSNTEYVDRDEVIETVQLMITTAKQRGAKTICVYSGPGRRYKNAPWPVYTDSYNARKIVTELGWPTPTESP